MPRFKSIINKNDAQRLEARLCQTSVERGRRLSHTHIVGARNATGIHVTRGSLVCTREGQQSGRSVIILTLPEGETSGDGPGNVVRECPKCEIMFDLTVGKRNGDKSPSTNGRGGVGFTEPE